jgi:hypothetical protein
MSKWKKKRGRLVESVQGTRNDSENYKGDRRKENTKNNREKGLGLTSHLMGENSTFLQLPRAHSGVDLDCSFPVKTLHSFSK